MQTSLAHKPHIWLLVLVTSSIDCRQMLFFFSWPFIVDTLNTQLFAKLFTRYASKILENEIDFGSSKMLELERVIIIIKNLDMVVMARAVS